MKHSFHLCPGAGIPHVVNMNTISINRWIREISNPLTEPIFHYMESATEQGLISSRWACLPSKLTNHVHEHQRFKGISKKPQPLNLEERIHQHWTLYHIWNSKSPPRVPRGTWNPILQLENLRSTHRVSQSRRAQFWHPIFCPNSSLLGCVWWEG